MNPLKPLPRADETQRTDKCPALSDTLFEQILSSDNLKRAWKRVRANKGAPGIDGVSIDDFPQYLRDHWPTVLVQLKAGTYQPSPVRRVRTDKDDGGVRELGIPIILDRFRTPNLISKFLYRMI